MIALQALDPLPDGLVIASPCNPAGTMLTPDELAAYYRDKYFGATDGRTPYAHGYTAEELEHKLLQPAETERVWNRAPGRLLEVGVGEGFTLDYFLKRGWQAKGLDGTLIPQPSRHHFNAIADFMDAKSPLCGALLRMMRVAH